MYVHEKKTQVMLEYYFTICCNRYIYLSDLAWFQRQGKNKVNPLNGEKGEEDQDEREEENEEKEGADGEKNEQQEEKWDDSGNDI